MVGNEGQVRGYPQKNVKIELKIEIRCGDSSDWQENPLKKCQWLQICEWALEERYQKNEVHWGQRLEQINIRKHFVVWF